MRSWELQLKITFDFWQGFFVNAVKGSPKTTLIKSIDPFPFVPHSIYQLTASHSKRSPLFHSAVLHSIPCCTCFLPTHNPQRRKKGVRQSFRFVPQNQICKGKCTPFGRPCIYRSLTSSFALRWVHTHCRSLVLLHTLSPSSLAAFQ
jgi:hypothetical protein